MPKIQTLGEMEKENSDGFINPERRPEEAAYWKALDERAAIEKAKPIRTLTDIISDDVDYMRNVTVVTNSLYSNVSIIDETGEQESIFLEGDEAEEFFDEVNDLYLRAQTVLEDDCILSVAKSYVETYWN